MPASGSGLRIAMFGSDGQLGRDLMAELKRHDATAVPHTRADVTDRKAVAQVMAELEPDWVITTVAFHDVDRCQDEPERALEVNALGAHTVAAEAYAVGARTIYLSTDYVFSGDKGEPNLERDRPEPINVYGACKLAGEALVRAADPNALVVRTSALFGHHPCRGKGGDNFVELMLRLGRERERVRVVDDEIVSPTYARHLARFLRVAISAELTGLVHAAGSGATSWFGLASAIFEESDMTTVVEPAAPGEFAKKAPRPAFSALASERLGDSVAPLPPWREGLRDYLMARNAV